jgi:EmrB/QacA subfamily drug resistance transporter
VISSVKDLDRCGRADLYNLHPNQLFLDPGSITQPFLWSTDVLIKTPCEGALHSVESGEKQCARAAEPWILAATILASSMAFIDGTVVNVAVPVLQSAMHATFVDVQWVVASYGLLMSSLILVGGALGDLLGRRKIFLLGVIIFAASSAACGMATGIDMLIFARSVQGIGAALLVPGSLSIIAASFDEKSRGRAIGTWSGFTSITTALGPVLGGWLIQHASWRWAFYLNLPIAIGVVTLSLWHVPESRGRRDERLDWVGALLVTVGVGGLVAGFIESSNLGWRNPIVIGALVVGTVSLLSFVWVESKAKNPIVPLQLFRSAGFLGGNLLTLFLYSAIGVFFFLFPMQLIRLEGYSATAAGAAGLPMILLMFALSRWAGGLVERFGGRLPLIVGPMVAALGFILFAILPGGNGYWLSFFPAFLVLGLGMSITVAPLTTVVMNSVDSTHTGAASGINNSVARVAGVLAVAVFGILMLGTFSKTLDSELVNLRLSQTAVQEIDSSKKELVNLQPPKDIDPRQREEFQSAVATAFRSGLHQILFCCAALSVAGALCAWKFVGRAPESILSRSAILQRQP